MASNSSALAAPPSTSTGVLRFLDGDGNLLNDNHNIDDDRLVELYRQMLRTRAFDEAAMRLQRIGRIPAYYPCAGQETHVAVASALEDRDWVFSQYREQGVRLARGVPVINELGLWRGMPHAFWDPTEHRITPMNVTIGTHLPQATGYGYGARLLGKDEISLALFGDGATSEVDFHAALNFAGVWKTPTVFFCQNNRYAQSTPIEQQTASETLAQKANAYGIEGVRVDGMDIIAVHTALDAAVAKARAGGGPTMIESLCYRYTPHSTYDGTPVYRTREEEAEWKEKDPLVRTRAYLLGRGLIDEEFEEKTRSEMRANVDAAIDELEAMPLPPRDTSFRSVCHKMPSRLVEQLHEEQAAAGEDLSIVSDDERYSPGDEIEPQGERKALTLVESLNLALDHAMSERDETVIMGEDVGREGGVFRVTADMYEKYGADRMLDTPLCELGIIGTAIGMSMAGVRPVCEMEFAGFAFTAFDQMISHVARYPWRTVGKVRLPMVIRMPGGGGHEGYEGHSDSTEALFAHPPGCLQVVYPSNAIDAKGLLATALESEDPVIFFEPIVKYFTRYDDVPVDHYTIPIGKARIARAGTDATIVTYGNTVSISEQAAAQLQDQGISVEVIDLRSIKPWDEQCVLDSIEKTGRLVVVHEAAKSGGFGAEIIATVMEKGGFLLETPPVRVAHADMPWAVAKLEPYSMIQPERIAVAVRKVMED
ncbi:MAG: thiamine pyrophosphate-dependent enzyme [Woeseiaceae bacterium]